MISHYAAALGSPMSVQWLLRGIKKWFFAIGETWKWKEGQPGYPVFNYKIDRIGKNIPSKNKIL